MPPEKTRPFAATGAARADFVFKIKPFLKGFKYSFPGYCRSFLLFTCFFPDFPARWKGFSGFVSTQNFGVVGVGPEFPENTAGNLPHFCIKLQMLLIMMQVKGLGE